MKRKRFLQALGSGATGVAAYSCRAQREAEELTGLQHSRLVEAGLDDRDLTWGKAPCRYCGTGCGVLVGVHNNRIMAVRGDPASPVNRGLLCVKGYHLPGMLYGNDRLLYPQMRDSSGKLQRVSWEEALDRIAREFQQALEESGPDAVAMYGSGQWTVFDGYAAVKWVKAGMRSNNIDPNARLCMASAVSGFMTQFQSDEPMGCYEDFEVGDDFLLWGANMAEMHPVLFSRMLETKRQNPRPVRSLPGSAGEAARV